MVVRYEAKTTIELSENERDQFRSLFRDVFGKAKTDERFRRQFLGTTTGYSYHALAFDEVSRLVGAYSVVPQRYSLGGRQTLLGLIVDTMVSPDYRNNPLMTMKLGSMLDVIMRKDGVVGIFGFPNDNVYEYSKKVMRFRDVGVLDFLVLPLRPGGFSGYVQALDRVGPSMARGVARCLRWFASGFPTKKHIEKVNDTCFQENRYGSEHRFLHGPAKATSVYSIHNEGAKRVAYIVDVHPFSPRNLYSAFADVIDAEGSSVDAIAYCGNSARWSPLRVPRFILPRQLRMVGRSLVSSLDEEKFFSLKHWHVNLSDFDVR